jgi:rhodanese-related sulfurtransferase
MKADFRFGLCVSLGLAALLLLCGCGGGSDSNSTPVAGVSAARLHNMMADGNPLNVVDVRPAEEYAVGHIPGSINLPLDAVATWGKTLDKTERICLVCSCVTSTGLSYQAGVALLAMGYEHVSQLDGGLLTWTYGMDDSVTVTDITGAQLLGFMGDGDPLLIIDVRGATEFAGSHIPGSVNMPLPDINTWLLTLDPAQRICCVCGIGARSRTAAAILVSKGFGNVMSLTGGMSTWTGPVEP